MNRTAFITAELTASADVKRKILEHCSGQIDQAVTILVETFRSGNKVLFCGNGGSAADSSESEDERVSDSPTVQKLSRPIPNSPWIPCAPFSLRVRFSESPMWVAT